MRSSRRLPFGNLAALAAAALVAALLTFASGAPRDDGPASGVALHAPTAPATLLARQAPVLLARKPTGAAWLAGRDGAPAAATAAEAALPDGFGGSRLALVERDAPAEAGRAHAWARGPPGAGSAL
ncbi:hypothetical protein NK718_20435 [Alsobacter sp. SYSU M60028]|uniref:Uncharacterized protein n=1 Tax=Alsobacter ponti TaxID=2962936 RepID=A0ABT1LHB6_9HYPH|nr:hypothetical protein [Alsobacter ponti]MCP8940902.1 hypothetical protein [Alsobacter ponti]